MKKDLGAFDLTMLGVGGIIGTGIFVLTGVAAAEHAGPALVLSFILSGLACIFVVFCGYLLMQLPSTTWISFGIWLVMGLVFYFTYGYKKSGLAKIDEGNIQDMTVTNEEKLS